MARTIILSILLASLPLTAAAADTSNLELNSDEGWCTVYVDGAEVGEIPLNSHRTVIKDIPAGEHFLRITDAFDKEWFNDVVDFPAGATLRAKAEPTGVTIINKPGEQPTPPPSGGLTKVKTNFVNYKQAPNMLFVTSAPAGATVTLDGRAAGVTPILRTDLAAGKHVVNVAGVEEEVDLKVGGLTQLDVTFGTMPTNPTGTTDNT